MTTPAVTDVERRETIAALVYEAMEYAARNVPMPGGIIPKWKIGGNAFAQDVARGIAMRIDCLPAPNVALSEDEAVEVMMRSVDHTQGGVAEDDFRRAYRSLLPYFSANLPIGVDSLASLITSTICSQEEDDSYSQGYAIARALLSHLKANVAPQGGKVECYPTPTWDDAKKFLTDIVDDTENFTGNMYWISDANGKAIAVTGCGPDGKRNAEALAHLPTEAAKDVQLRASLKHLTDEQRIELFSDYCTHCGCNDPRCQCWNDE